MLKQSLDETGLELLPYTGVHTVIHGVIHLPPLPVGLLCLYGSIVKVVCILVSLVQKYTSQ